MKEKKKKTQVYALHTQESDQIVRNHECNVQQCCKNLCIKTNPHVSYEVLKAETRFYKPHYFLRFLVYSSPVNLPQLHTI